MLVSIKARKVRVSIHSGAIREVYLKLIHKSDLININYKYNLTFNS